MDEHESATQPTFYAKIKEYRKTISRRQGWNKFYLQQYTTHCWWYQTEYIKHNPCRSINIIVYRSVLWRRWSMISSKFRPNQEDFQHNMMRNTRLEVCYEPYLKSKTLFSASVCVLVFFFYRVESFSSSLCKDILP